MNIPIRTTHFLLHKFSIHQVCFCLYVVFTSNESFKWGFPGGSAGKESACNAGDLGPIPGLGRSPGEDKGCLLQYSSLENPMDYTIHGVAKSRTRLSNFHFTSLVAQKLESMPAMQETLVRSLGQEDPLEKGTATHSSILAWRILWTVQAMGSQRVRHT